MIWLFLFIAGWVESPRCKSFDQIIHISLTYGHFTLILLSSFLLSTMCSWLCLYHLIVHRRSTTDCWRYVLSLLWVSVSAEAACCVLCLIIDIRGGRRDWKRLYVYTADARHSHVTLSKVRESHNFATPQRLHLLPSRESLCIVAELPKVLKKESDTFSEQTCRWAAILALWYFPGTCEQCRPSLNASIDPASGKEC